MPGEEKRRLTRRSRAKHHENKALEPGDGLPNYRMFSFQFSSADFTLAMNWWAVAPSTTRWS